MRGAPEDKKPQKMVRSSIACSRCRRSKVKCVNEGAGTTCKACLSSKRECSYPNGTTSTPAPKRSEATVGIKIEGESGAGESKKRVRKIENVGRRNSQKPPAEDVLDAPYLTRQVWDDLYEKFKLHFSTEMPFLHPPSFRNLMRKAAHPRDPSVSAAEIEEQRVLLLGVLALTARFNPTLVSQHSQNQDPLVASELYANALATALGPTIRTMSRPSLINIQALLMIGLYDWGQARGMSAWLYVGLATRSAFPMGLAVEDDPERLAVQNSSKNPAASRDGAIEKEVRRRTLWSCFIMDRMLSAGKERPTMIDTDLLRVQLPCSDDQFLFVKDVKTSFLKPLQMWDQRNGQEALRDLTYGSDEGVLSKYIRLIEIFGQFSVWSYAGGRRARWELPPWKPNSNFNRLRKQLYDFYNSLPANLQFNEANLHAHIEKRNATTYASLHTLYCLCLIVLHREYLPFVPLKCERPTGPLDSPTFSREDEEDMPRGFWEESADQIMKAARDIIDVVKTCDENNALLESPQIGFAVWQAAFVCLYATWFPNMDIQKRLVAANFYPSSTNPPNTKAGIMGDAQRILKGMVPRLKMVKKYLDDLNKMNSFFHGIYRDFKKLTGGGLDQYKAFEKDLKEFGDIKDPAPSETSDIDHTRSRASTMDASEFQGNRNGEPMNGVEHAPVSAFTAVNRQALPNSSSPANDYRSQANPSPYGVPVYSPSNAPSLMTSNGESTPGMGSPFVGNQYQPPHYQPIAPNPMGPPQSFPNGMAMPTEGEFIDTWNKAHMPPPLDNLVQDEGMDSMNNNWSYDSFQQDNYVQQAYGQQTVQLGMQ